MEAISRREGLVHAAKEAGITVPEDIYSSVREEFPHWVLFCDCQIDRPLQDDTSHYKNAIALASISEEDMRGLRYRDVQILLID